MSYWRPDNAGEVGSVMRKLQSLHDILALDRLEALGGIPKGSCEPEFCNEVFSPCCSLGNKYSIAGWRYS